MKKIKIWMEYVGRSEAEIEVEDDISIPARIDDWPVEWLSELDDNLSEMSPSDWGIL